MVEITWYGHACIGLQAGRARVVMDPYGPTLGLTPLHTTADIVSTSHDNPAWHSYTAGVGGHPQLRLAGLQLAHEPVTALGMRFTALVVGEDLDRGGAPNAMVRVELDGLRCVHFGDLGHAIAPREARFLADAEVWFALAGGPPTIPVELLAEAWHAAPPKVVIPIHYRTPSLARFGKVDDWLQLLPASAIRKCGAARVTLSPESLPDTPEVWVLEPLGDPAVAAAAAGEV